MMHAVFLILFLFVGASLGLSEVKHAHFTANKYEQYSIHCVNCPQYIYPNLAMECWWKRVEKSWNCDFPDYILSAEFESKAGEVEARSRKVYGEEFIFGVGITTDWIQMGPGATRAIVQVKEDWLNQKEHEHYIREAYNLKEHAGEFISGMGSGAKAILWDVPMAMYHATVEETNDAWKMMKAVYNEMTS